MEPEPRKPMEKIQHRLQRLCHGQAGAGVPPWKAEGPSQERSGAWRHGCSSLGVQETGQLLSRLQEFIAQCFHHFVCHLFLVLGMKRNVVLWSLAAGCADSLSGFKGGDSLGGHARSCPSCAGWSGRPPAPSSLLLQGHASDFRLLLLPPPHAP